MKITNEQLTGLTQTHLTDIQVGEKSFLVNTKIKADLEALINDAKQQGFDFSIASSFRDFHRQAAIWDQKFSGQRAILDHQSQPLDPKTLTDIEKIHAIMRWSALPGSSRHHWGTDIDVYARNCLPKGVSLQLEPWEYQQAGHQAEFSQWLESAMPNYGFYLPYKEDLGGVAQEPWHISHIEMGQKMLALTNIELLLKTWQQHTFLGADSVEKNIDALYERYIVNIADC